ncbi:hypothetical protein ACIQOU_29785 [Streptomyces sp. NPDC091279]|uniref:hypothetical protein n=1 Tax=Streptomyces sp. NPDC091279 TaxID=3365983 RepID=UPI0038006512
MNIARRLTHGRLWLRVFVLLLALLVPAETFAAPALTASVESVEYGLADAAVRPVAHTAAQQAAVPPRPAPLPVPARPAAGHRPPPGPPAAARALRLLRTVILRC